MLNQICKRLRGSVSQAKVMMMNVWERPIVPQLSTGRPAKVGREPRVTHGAAKRRAWVLEAEVCLDTKAPKREER